MSHPLVEIVKSWETFENNHPGSSAEEFCHFFLKQKAKEKPGAIRAPAPVMGYTNALGVHIHRLSKFMNFFARKIMKGLDVDNTEDFYYTATLHFEGKMRKSDLIQRNISEVTSGSNVINRLLVKGLIQEMPDPEDARSKLVEITKQGILWMNECLEDMVFINKLTLHMLSEKEKKAAMNILEKVDRYHSDHFPLIRQASVQQIKDHYKLK